MGELQKVSLNKSAKEFSTATVSQEVVEVKEDQFRLCKKAKSSYYAWNAMRNITGKA